MKLQNRLFKGSLLNLWAVGFNQGSTLLVNILIARILMQQAYGEYAMIQSTLITIATISQLATGYTAAKYVAEFRTKSPVRAGRIMGLCAMIAAVMAIIGTIAMILAAPWIAERILKAPHLANPVRIGAGYLFFTTINGFQTGSLSGLEAFRSLAKAGTISGISAIIVITIGTWYGSLTGAIIGLNVAALIRCIVHNRWLNIENKRREIKPKYRFNYSEEREVIRKYALPSAITGFYLLPMVWLSNSVLVQQPGGYEEMALFSAANNLRIIVLFVPNVINVVGLSLLNNEKGNGTVSQYNRLFKTNIIVIFIISLALSSVFALLGRPFLLLFGDDFQGGYFMLLILLSSCVFEGLNIALNQYLQTQAKIWRAFLIVTIPREAARLIIAYFLTQLYGGIGLAIAYLLASILGFILFSSQILFFFRRERKVEQPAEKEGVQKGENNAYL